MVLATVNLITGQYSHLSIDDIKLCISNLYTGLYGEIIALDIERFGKALATYSKQKQETAISYAGATSNQFPKAKDWRPCKMPEDVRQILKEKIGYIYMEKEEVKPSKINWKEKMPSLTDEEVTIFEWFDDKWNEQGCPLQSGSTDQVIEWNDRTLTRGEFTVEAKKII